MKVLAAGAALWCVVSALPAQYEAPSPDSLGSDLTVILHNDLYGKPG